MENEWYTESFKEGLRQAEEKRKAACPNCVYYESGTMCADCKSLAQAAYWLRAARKQVDDGK